MGVLALLAGAAVFALSMGNDPDEAAAEAVGRIKAMKPSETGVKPLDMAAFETTMSLLRKPPTLTDVSGTDAKITLVNPRSIERSEGKAKRVIDRRVLHD